MNTGELASYSQLTAMPPKPAAKKNAAPKAKKGNNDGNVAQAKETLGA
jgi:hypothetical protein